LENLDSEKLNIATKTKLGVAQVKNTATFSSLNDVKITKVLTACARPNVENITPQNAEVKIDGVVEYDLLVVLENNEIMPLTQKSNFSHVFENSAITPETVINVKSEILELNNVSNTNGDIVYSALINLDVFAINQNANLSCARAIDGVFVKEGEVNFNSFAGNVVYDASVNYDIAKDSKVNKILFVNSCATIKSVIPSTNYFVVSGEVYSTIVYQSEDGQIKCLNRVITYSEEIENANVLKDSFIQAVVKTKETVVVENTEKNVFNFETPIQITAQIYNKNTFNCVVDAYSLQNEVNLTTTSFEQDDFLITRQIEENIITSFALADNIPAIDKILAVIPTNVSIVNQIIKDGELLLEGIANINIIYYFEDEEGNNILNSIDAEVPYSITLQISDLTKDDKLQANIVIGDISVKNKHGKELEILAEAKIDYNIIKPSISAVTTQLTLGEEKPQKDYALEIYLAKENQTLWDIAKELNVSSTDLVNQNNDLTLPLSAGDKVVSYNQRIVDFE